MLVGAAVVALLWVNSPWDASYFSLLATRISFGAGDLVVAGDLHFWINEGLMALFFLVVGLEIKRELTTGELRRLRAALLPVVVAATGMAVPALVYLAIVSGGTGSSGWAIPMATDVAFALGVLALAASRTPGALRPLLLAIAIVDDIGSVVVVAAFSGGAVSLGWLAVCVAVAGLISVCARIQIRATLVSVALSVALGVALWYAMFRAGLHPALAGVVVGLLMPSEPFQRPRAVDREARPTAELRETVSPLARVEHVLLPWTSFVVLPLFAFANVGVRLSVSSLAAAAGSVVAWGIFAARIGGKIVGIWGGATLATRVGLVDLPGGIRSVHLAGMAAAAGTGFTVSLFVAEVVFGRDGPLLAHVKISLLAASIVSAVVAVSVLRRASGPATKPT